MISLTKQPCPVVASGGNSIASKQFITPGYLGFSLGSSGVDDELDEQLEDDDELDE